MSYVAHIGHARTCAFAHIGHALVPAHVPTHWCARTRDGCTRATGQEPLRPASCANPQMLDPTSAESKEVDEYLGGRGYRRAAYVCQDAVFLHQSFVPAPARRVACIED